MASMTNAVRLSSVLSKFGETTQADIGKLIRTCLELFNVQRSHGRRFSR